MTFKKEREFIRLTHNEPLMLSVSALCDFLWEDFVRESQPTVNYLIDHYNITQLSRFGKEIFDYLYNGGAVTPLVTEDEAENYFRAKQNGENPALPTGYKPENAFWVKLFLSVTQAPAWPNIQALSCGDQFNSGNNAVNILNKLSEIIEAQIQANQTLAYMLTQGREEVQQLREQFLQAKKDGDDLTAAELRKKGKALGQKMEEILSEAAQKANPAVSKAMDKVCQESNELNDAFSSLAGDTIGIGAKTDDLQAKLDLAKKLKKNKNLKELITKIGALKRAWANRKRAKKSQSNYSDVVAAKFSDDVKNAYPIELALAGDQLGKALFALKYSQKTLLTKDYEAKTNELNKGPIVMYIDISGSMAGQPEIWSKAITYVIAEECLEQNRELQIHLFDSIIQDSVTLKGSRKTNRDLIDFVMTWMTKGGTSFCSVINHALCEAKIDPRADILMITDGEANVTDAFIKRLNTFKAEKDLQWSSFCIGRKSHVLNEFSDEVFSVNIDDDSYSAELFQKSIR
jgi:uncharacterized protein with von Willebrand factor type A (vWA) domain